MSKYDINNLHAEQDQNRTHYKKWFIHLNPINNVTFNELCKRKDTVAEIRIVSFYKDEAIEHNSCEYSVYYYPNCDKGLCETIFEDVRKHYATYEDAIVTGKQIGRAHV